MNLQDPHLAELWERFASKKATPDELEQLFTFLQQADSEPTILRLLDNYFGKPVPAHLFDREYWLTKAGDIIPVAADRQPLVRRMGFRRKWLRYAAAAFFVIAAGVLTVWLSRKERQPSFATAGHLLQGDVMPGHDGAVLTLADGRKVSLDSLGNGVIARQGKTTVAIEHGLLSYDVAAAAGTDILYNTITTPRGRQYRLALPDGTQVWLNAGSSLTYPVSFARTDRKVSVSGEAYFEVAHDALRPFTVSKGNMEVRVLGTHFNVNAYDDEDAIRVTLLEGSVRITKNSDSKILKPGQQAILRQDGEEGSSLRVSTDVDIDQVMAWRDGWFEFAQSELPVVMRQISRWYDLDIRYEGKLPNDTYGGRISKNLPLSQMLKMLESNGVKFTLEGKILKVKP
jgi:transmembrane sensor